MSNNATDVQIHNPPNRLKAKLGTMSSVFDAKAVARAEAALVTLSDNFGDWLDEEVVKLSKAHQASSEPFSGDAHMSVFYRCAHDLKGLGTTYGYPIISEFAGSLCRLLDSPEARARAPREVLECPCGCDCCSFKTTHHIFRPCRRAGLATRITIPSSPL
ncbi:MAG: Hpt domain-containing protein [Hyphomonadaceae bacterium]|nr:Hpt domain-containing protein [Hyphomonadaceae bacterium]